MNTSQSNATQLASNEPGSPPVFVDRRGSGAGQSSNNHSSGIERRQFGNSYNDLTPDAREFAEAVDNFKIQHSRRFVTYEELLTVVKSLGYARS
jgi:hypothetical protein